MQSKKVRENPIKAKMDKSGIKKKSLNLCGDNKLDFHFQFRSNASTSRTLSTSTKTIENIKDPNINSKKFTDDNKQFGMRTHITDF